MLGSSKKKVHISCQCRQCQHARGMTGYKDIIRGEEKAFRQQTKQELRKAMRELARELDEIDIPYNMPGLRLG
jgi:hypothetical protein